MKIKVELNIPEDQLDSVKVLLASLAKKLNEESRGPRAPVGVHAVAEIQKEIFNQICNDQNWLQHWVKRVKLA